MSATRANAIYNSQREYTRWRALFPGTFLLVLMDKRTSSGTQSAISLITQKDVVRLAELTILQKRLTLQLAQHIFYILFCQFCCLLWKEFTRIGAIDSALPRLSRWKKD